MWPYRVLMNAANARERSPISDAVAAQIRAERAAAGKTQAQVYEPAGIPKQTYIRIEKGVRVADITQILQVCTSLGIPLGVFMTRAEARARGEVA